MAGEHSRERGVSPVVGVILVVAITILIATVVGTVALGFGDRLPDENPTNVAYDAEYIEDGADNSGRPYIEVTITGGRVSLGSDAYVVDEAGNRVAWTAVWSGGTYLEAGETFTIDGVNNVNGNDKPLENPCDRETYRVVRLNDNNQSSEVVMRVTAGTAVSGATGC